MIPSMLSNRIKPEFMEHPQSQQFHHHPHQHQQAPQVGQHQFPVVPGEDGHTHHHQPQMVRRSISHQDVLGRVGDSTRVANLPPDLERLTISHARSTENIAVLDNNVKYHINDDVEGVGSSHTQPIYQDGAMSYRPQQGSLQSSGRIRMPFPPVPKIDQMPVVSTATVSQPPLSSGFGTITTTKQVSQFSNYPPLPQVYPSQEDQGWRIPQYKRRPPAEAITSQHQPQGGYPPPPPVTNVMGPPHPPHHHPGHLPHYYQAHGQGHLPPHPHAAHGQVIWNNRENRFVFDFFFE